MQIRHELSNWHLFIVVMFFVGLVLLGGFVAHLILYGDVIKWIIKTLILSCT
jgi:hypothetical protein